MANLTITIGDDALKKARIRAITEGTSVNALLRSYLESYARINSDQSRALQEIFTLSNQSGSRRGSKVWDRDELHERR